MNKMYIFLNGVARLLETSQFIVLQNARSVHVYNRLFTENKLFSLTNSGTYAPPIYVTNFSLFLWAGWKNCVHVHVFTCKCILCFLHQEVKILDPSNNKHYCLVTAVYWIHSYSLNMVLYIQTECPMNLYNCKQINTCKWKMNFHYTSVNYYWTCRKYRQPAPWISL